MTKDFLKTFSKGAFYGVIWSSVLLFISFSVSNNYSFLLNDILFLIGILSIFISSLASFGGNSVGLSLQGFGFVSAQYVTNLSTEANLKKQTTTIQNINNIDICREALFIGGLISILLNFII